MSSGPLRLVIAALVLCLLARRRPGPGGTVFSLPWCGEECLRHMAGAFGLFTLVATLASLLLTSPLLRFGLGSTVGFSGNAVFTPLEELTARSGLLAADGG